MNAVRALLRECIDYAGLFPPAKLDLASTVQNYASYLDGGDEWALGRLVLPAAKLSEFVERWPEYSPAWPISAVLGQDYGAEVHLALKPGVRVETVECRPACAEHVAEIRRRLPGEIKLFVEASAASDLDEMLTAIEGARACAKLRTGGITPDAIPSVLEVAGFLVNCARRGLCLKATAGLHHAIRGEHPLTYEPDAPQSTMHGFINLLIAALIAFEGEGRIEVQAALESEASAEFVFCDRGIQWNGRNFPVAAIEEMRSRFAVGFGSCSFEEPMQELRSMGWLRA